MEINKFIESAFLSELIRFRINLFRENIGLLNINIAF